MYYPKSQIKTNLYNNKNFLVLSSTKKQYIGYYYETSNGKKYTGKNPQDKPNILLIEQSNEYDPTQEIPMRSSPIDYITLIDPNPPFATFNTSQYNKNNNITLNQITRKIPYFNPTLPTNQDKIKGQYTRYFCKKTNELKYLEIDKETHDKLLSQDPKIAWDLYNPASLLWVIKGNQETVFNINKAAIFKVEQNQKWNGFSQYFKENYLKSYQSLDISNLYTSGGEFKTKNGQEYIGFYHIHNGTIPMVGKNHIKESHETLTPIKSIITSTTSSIPQTPTYTSSTSTGGNYSGGGSGGGGSSY